MTVPLVSHTYSSEYHNRKMSGTSADKNTTPQIKLQMMHVTRDMH